MLVRRQQRMFVRYDAILREIDLDLTVGTSLASKRSLMVSMTRSQTARLIALLQRALAKFPAPKQRKKA